MTAISNTAPARREIALTSGHLRGLNAPIMSGWEFALISYTCEWVGAVTRLWTQATAPTLDEIKAMLPTETEWAEYDAYAERDSRAFPE